MINKKEIPLEQYIKNKERASEIIRTALKGYAPADMAKLFVKLFDSLILRTENIGKMKTIKDNLERLEEHKTQTDKGRA